MEITLHNMESGKSESKELAFGAVTIKNESGTIRIVFDDDGVSIINDDGTFTDIDKVGVEEERKGLLKRIMSIITK